MTSTMSSAPSYRLFNPMAVAGITFLGGSMAGGILLAINFKRLGNSTAAWVSLIVGFVVTVGLMALALALPSGSSSGMCALPIVQMAIAGQLAKQMQGPAYAKHIEAGGSAESGWKALGIGVASLAGILVVCFGMVLFMTENVMLNEHYDVSPKEQIFFTGKITRDEVAKIAELLKTAGFFTGKGEKSIQVKRSGGVTTLSFVLSEVGWKDPEILKALEEFVRQNIQALGGPPIKLRIVDSEFTVKKEVLVK